MLDNHWRNANTLDRQPTAFSYSNNYQIKVIQRAYRPHCGLFTHWRVFTMGPLGTAMFTKQGRPSKAHERLWAWLVCTQASKQKFHGILDLLTLMKSHGWEVAGEKHKHVGDFYELNHKKFVNPQQPSANTYFSGLNRVFTTKNVKHHAYTPSHLFHLTTTQS